jgi:hypothetical protein
MKNIITIITIALCSSIYAQPASVMNITYIDVPRTEADAFLASHVKFSNMSISEDRKILAHGILTHAFADNYTFAFYDFYASSADVEKDSDLANLALQENVKAMNLDEEAQQALNKEYFTYFRNYAENHTDQIRVANEEMVYESEQLDWSTKKITTVGKFDIKWGKGGEALKAWQDGQLESYKKHPGVEAVYGSNHLFGSGMGLHIYTFYSDWESFASYESANFGSAMDENGKTFWSAVDAHEDEIMVWIGGMNPETKEVYLVE